GGMEEYKIHILGSGWNPLIGGTNDRSGDMEFDASNSFASYDIALFPNPAKTLVTVKWHDVQPIAGQLVSATGQTLLTFGQNDAPTRLDVTNYPNGLYTLQVVTSDKQMVTKRFVKVD